MKKAFSAVPSVRMPAARRQAFLRLGAMGALAAMVLASCLPPLFDAIITLHVSDKVLPSITVTSPQDGSPYSSAIQIKGSVKDLADNAGAPGRVDSLAYEVLASSTSGVITVAVDGSFDVTFLASSLHGPLTIRLTATDWNGNVAQASFGMIDSGNGIPGFAAATVSGSVTLTWPSVPLVDHYELYYETSDTLPSEQFSAKLSPVTSGVTLTGLTNGRVHAYLLKSIPAAGSGAAINWSTVQKVIPLSKVQLVPRVEPGYASINVMWTIVPGTTSYEVWKGTSDVESSFVNVSGTVQGASFVDEAVVPGCKYYYAVKPAQYSQLLSWSTPATPDLFPLNSRRELARVATAGTVSSMASSANGRYLYVVDGADGIVVYDILVPGAPVRQGKLGHPSQPLYSGPGTITTPFLACALGPNGYVVAISGVDDGENVMYGRVSVIDVTNPAAPIEVGYQNTGTSAPGDDYQALGFAVSGTRVFVNEWSWSGSPRLKDFDINPATGALTPKKEIAALGGDAGSVQQTEAAGNTVYQATDTGVQIFTADATTGVFTLKYTLTTGLSDHNRTVRYFTSGASKYLYLGNWAGFRIIDVTNDTNPSVVSTWTTPSSVIDIRLASGRAYISTSSSGLLVYDVSAPLSPALAGSYRVVAGTSCSVPAGDALFLGLADPMRGFRTLDAGIPRPAYHGDAAGSNYVMDLAVRDRFAYTTSNGVIDIYDLGGGIWPLKVATISTSAQGGSGGIAVSGNLLVTGSTTVSLYDISTPLSPSLLASIPVATYLTDVKIAGSFVHAAIRDFGLKIIDISSPNAPKELGSLPLAGGQVKSLAVTGTTAYVTHGYTKIAVIDVSDPLAPRLLMDFIPGYHGPVSSQNWGYDIETAGSFAYVAEGDGGLIIVDISNPSSPVERGHVSPPSTMQDYYRVAVQGEYAYVARDSGGVSLVSIADPDNPVLVSTIVPPVSPADYPRDIAIQGSTLVTVSPGVGSYGGLIGYVTK